ncbi:MAG: flagellar motor switch protein FliN [Pseudomonadota bacterium]|jgi:flagellar motor switch protein FliN/FliY
MSEEDQIMETATPPELQAAAGGSGEIDLDLLMDVPVYLTVEVGRKKMTIKELLSLTSGSVVSFDRSVTEPMDIMVNGTLVARGEVVSADGQFGLRLVDVVSAKERLQQLG